MGVDKSSPRYAEYLAECKSLFDEYDRKEQEYLQEYPGWLGQDHPNGGKIRAVVKARNRAFHQIKQKYGFAD